METAELASRASAHFMVHSSEKYWSGATLTWALSDD